MLLYVVDSHGSSPGRTGFCMVINAEGQMSGSIGGGIMEYKFVELAKQRFKESSSESMIVQQYHDKEASTHQSGMICSGEQTIFLYTPKQADLLQVHNIIDCLENEYQGMLLLSAGSIRYADSTTTSRYSFSNKGGKWLYTEKLGYGNNVYIIGGGHCSLALSSLMSTMDFYITLMDDRKDLYTMKQNSYAHDMVLMENFENIGDSIPENDHTFVVVMTIGYRTDDVVVRQLINKKIKYLGILGSKAKIKKMFDTYRTEGMDEHTLHKIYAPIGLEINSQTPEEIAVSIAAEIIGVRSK